LLLSWIFTFFCFSSVYYNGGCVPKQTNLGDISCVDCIVKGWWAPVQGTSWENNIAYHGASQSRSPAYVSNCQETGVFPAHI